MIKELLIIADDDEDKKWLFVIIKVETALIKGMNADRYFIWSDLLTF